MNHKEKISKYLKIKGVNPNQFYKKCGLGNGFLSSGKYFGTDKLLIILDNYRDLNLNWLLFDEGNMILEDGNAVNEPVENYQNVTIESLKETIAAKNETIAALRAQLEMHKDVERGRNERSSKAS